jgi:hypothetical protein
MIESTERPLPPPLYPTHTQVTSVYFKRGGGCFHVQYRGNVLLWAKSDDSKKKPGPLLLVYFMYSTVLYSTLTHTFNTGLHNKCTGSNVQC